MHKTFHYSIKNYVLAEIKKTAANSLHRDTSCKESKRLTHYNCMSVFKGLFTSTNELGEVRMKFHVVTNAHDQMVPTIEVHKKTCDIHGHNNQSMCSMIIPADIKDSLNKCFYLE